MNLLAICIPTYNQPEMIREMIIRCMDIYYTFKIDVYLYDSSPDNKTESIVAMYKKDYHNIYYRHLSENIHSNIKVLEAYKEIIGMGKYQYLWLCPDYIQLTLQGVKCVVKHCLSGFDICVLNYRDVERIGEKTYTNINRFFLDCAWHMSSYMATIIYLPSFSDVEWEKFYKRYVLPRRINHSHLALYFEHLTKLPKIKAIHVPISSVHIRVSSYREQSFWRKDIFPIWCDYWPDTINALPDQYQYKDEVIKKLGVNTGILSWGNFVKLRKEGIYNLKVYHQYAWEKLTNVPRGCLWVLSIVPVHILERLKPLSLKQSLLNWRLRTFGKKYRNILIYGCGFMAQKTSILLDELHIQYCGYIVSDGSKEKKKFNDLPVIECGKLPKRTSEIGIIMALSKENTLQVMKEKDCLAAYKIFYMYKYEKLLNRQ